MFPAVRFAFIPSNIPLRSARRGLHRFNGLLSSTAVLQAPQRRRQPVLDKRAERHVRIERNGDAGDPFILVLQLILHAKNLHVRRYLHSKLSILLTGGACCFDPSMMTATGST